MGTQAFQLTLSSSRTRLRYPSRLRLSAALLTGNGEPVRGARVLFEAEVDDEFVPVANARTDRDGRCSVRLRIRKGRRYRARVSSDGDTGEAISSPMSVVVVPELEAELAAARGESGKRAVIAGLMRPRKRYIHLELERLSSADQWRLVDTREVRLLRGGTFEHELTLNQPGTYRCRVLFAGDASHGDTASRWFVVKAL